MSGLHTTWTLDSVEAWAGWDYLLLRETEIAAPGRYDGLLVPVSQDAAIMKRNPATHGFWSRPGLIGVEVKVSRADFLAGLRKGQYERYRDSDQISGLYLATPREVCKTSEIPEGVGHLVVFSAGNDPGNQQWRCVCKRRPRWKDSTIAVEYIWMILFAMRKKMTLEVRDERQRVGSVLEQIGFRVARTFADPVTQAIRDLADKL